MTKILLYVSILFLVSCSQEKEEVEEISFCYNTEDVKFNFNIPDSIYFNESITIKGFVNKPLTMIFFIDNTKIGEISEMGKLIWTPSCDIMEAGKKSISVQIKICNEKNKNNILGKSENIILLNR